MSLDAAYGPESGFQSENKNAPPSHPQTHALPPMASMASMEHHPQQLHPQQQYPQHPQYAPYQNIQHPGRNVRLVDNAAHRFARNDLVATPPVTWFEKNKTFAITLAVFIILIVVIIIILIVRKQQKNNIPEYVGYPPMSTYYPPPPQPYYP